MQLTLTVVAGNPTREAFWVEEITRVLGDFPELMIHGYSEHPEYGQMVCLDAELSDLPSVINGIERGGRSLFLLVQDPERVPSELSEGKVDDVLVHPLRRLEILSKISLCQHLTMWQEVTKMNTSFGQLLEGLREDLSLAERLQKARLPLRFPDIRGFKVASRYLAGLKSGGDYLDIAESRDGSQLSLILSDSSSYGLSSAVLSVLMRVALKLSTEEARSSFETVRRIRSEILATLSEKDSLSLFYGVVSQKDFVLRYLNLGSSSAFHAQKGYGFKELPSQCGPITRHTSLPTTSPEAELILRPEDRLVILSDGFVEAAGGAEKLCQLLDSLREKEPVDSINELVYQVKSKLTEEDDLPAQDCTAMILDADSRVIRLAPR